ncbi:MAG: GNAT family N-acetyltransferase [Cloacibacterium sp.]|nr:GNAT family N-acetyltransferase [Cloacibacterium sp.]
MKNPVEINFFEKKDLEQLNYCLDDVQKTFTSMPDFALERIAERNDGKAFPITIFFEKRAVGFFVLDFGEDKFGLTSNADAVLLRSLSLNPNFQQKGIAKESMFLTDDFVKTKFIDCNEIVLAVNSRNQNAYQLYMKTGYADTGKTRPFRDGFQHILTKKL